LGTPCSPPPFLASPHPSPPHLQFYPLCSLSRSSRSLSMPQANLPAPPLVSARPRSVKRKAGRPTSAATRGRKARFTALVRAGELEAARAWHKTWNLAAYGIPSPPLPSSLAPLAPATLAATTGGEGVDQPHGRDNWDKTTPAVQILQCSPVATAGVVPLTVEADLTRLAAKAVYTPTVTPPAGESEGDRGFGQAESRSEVQLI